ncbi:uncharacterized protein BBA_09216 [Beauveria bassiana ARSEF 2860]|uniref:Uncharacterized protein n=1 Tax=Beauveria bassiana (strain ARSEF 2860) TaxID=655819 RepID=J4KLA8_BEAB2|nr:uncharacterized protein BBA_09216 [Beauveria bassiana ARSEF 2860]EJP61879.1 hypothetical protein BBA_09216 [Beauveria bassiana ARSEF 2860]
MPCNRNLRRQPRERDFAAGEHAAYLRLNCETSEDDETALLISSSASESGNSDVETVEHLAGSDDLAAQGSGSERSWPDSTEDNAADRLIELQLEETCAQACLRLLRYVDCENVYGMKNCSSKIFVARRLDRVAPST